MIIKFTPTPTPEHVDMAWMQMQSLLEKHLPIQHKRKNVLLFISKIAAVFLLLLQIPVAFQMGSMNVSQVQKPAEDYTVINTVEKVNKAHHYTMDNSFIRHASVQVKPEDVDYDIKTIAALPELENSNVHLEQKEIYFSSVLKTQTDVKKIDLSIPSEHRSSSVDVQFAVKSNLPLHIQDMVSNDQQRIRSAQYLDIPLNVTIPVSSRINVHAGVQVSYLQDIQTKEMFAINNSIDMPSVSTLVVPVARTIAPAPNMSQDISVKNINRGLNAGVSYKAGPGEVGVLYQYGSGQIYGMQGSNKNRHNISISFKCPIK